MELLDGVILEMPVLLPATPTSISGDTTPTASLIRAASDSWLLQQYTGVRENWEGVRVVRQQLLEELVESNSSIGNGSTIALTLPS